MRPLQLAVRHPAMMQASRKIGNTGAPPCFNKPERLISSLIRALGITGIRGYLEPNLAQRDPVCRELQPTRTVGRCRGGLRLADALFSPLLMFVRLSHTHSPFTATAIFRLYVRLRYQRWACSSPRHCIPPASAAVFITNPALRLNGATPLPFRF